VWAKCGHSIRRQLWSCRVGQIRPCYASPTSAMPGASVCVARRLSRSFLHMPRTYAILALSSISRYRSHLRLVFCRDPFHHDRRSQRKNYPPTIQRPNPKPRHLRKRTHPTQICDHLRPIGHLRSPGSRLISQISVDRRPIPSRIVSMANPCVAHGVCKWLLCAGSAKMRDGVAGRDSFCAATPATDCSSQQSNRRYRPSPLSARQ
jgi:hypothetical protein